MTEAYKRKYKYWSDTYPWYIVVKQEWCFWAVRWEDAEVLHKLLWFKVVDNSYWKYAWWTNLENIIWALETGRYDYVVIQNGECVIEKTFDRFITK